VHQVGNQPRLYYDARSTTHQELPVLLEYTFSPPINPKGLSLLCRHILYSPGDISHAVVIRPR